MTARSSTRASTLGLRRPSLRRKATCNRFRNGGRPDPGQAQHGHGERARFGVLGLAPAVTAVKPILLPGPVKERDQPVIEQVEPVSQGEPLGHPRVAFEPHQQLGVVPGQDAARAGQPEERLGQDGDRLRRRRPLEVVDRAGRERQRVQRPEPHRLRRRRATPADRHLRRVDQVEQPHRLEEVEFERLLEQPLRQPAQLPARRGGVVGSAGVGCMAGAL